MSDNEFTVDIQSLTNKNWKLKEYSDRQIDFISQKYGLSRLVSKLLNIRNISEQDIPSYINPSLKESLPTSNINTKPIISALIFNKII